jgi:hypothetical protein
MRYSVVSAAERGWYTLEGEGTCSAAHGPYHAGPGENGRQMERKDSAGGKDGNFTPLRRLQFLQRQLAVGPSIFGAPGPSGPGFSGSSGAL